MDFVAVQDVLIEGNKFTDFYPADGDHADYIQFWSAGAAHSSKNVVIRDNFMTQSGGDSVQGIFIKDEGGLGYQNFLIENNVVYQSGYHGITVGSVDGLQIKGNTVLSTVDTSKDTWIQVFDSENVSVTDNVATEYKIENDGSVVLSNNVVAEPGGDFGPYYEGLFAKALTGDVSDYEDFILNQNIDAGANVTAIMMRDEAYAGTHDADAITGNQEANSLYGFGGKDTLDGGAGDDTLLGGWGEDKLTGGEGDDVFAYFNAKDSAAAEGEYDTITDFGAGDKISFEGLVDGGFEFIGGNQFFGKTYSAAEQIQQLENAADSFGSGVVSLGRDASMFNMDSFTLSTTFELFTANKGEQAVLWNHTQYGITIKGEDLQVVLRNESGNMQYYTIEDAIKEPGWYDIQVVVDDDKGTLDVWLNGDSVFSRDGVSVDIGGPSSWDVTAGGLPWGKALDGQVADVSILNEAVDISATQSTYERTVEMDSFDDYMTMDLATGDTQVRYDEAEGMLYADLNGDQEADMQIELIGVAADDLNKDSFLS